MPRTLDPTLDVVFKLLFAQAQNRELLVSLLTAVLSPAAPILEVSVLNPEVPKGAVDDKGAMLDLLVRLGDGALVDVEMQSQGRPGMRSRAAYYWARMVASELRRGQEHGALRRAVVVLLLGYRELPTERFHCMFQIREAEEHTLLTDLCEIHTVELRKVGGVSREREQAEAALVRWARFLVARDEHEREELAKMDPVMRKAKDALDLLSADPSAQELAREREFGLFCYEHSLRTAREEAEAKGKAEGKASALLVLLAARDIALAADAEARIRASRDLGELDGWIRRAATVSSVAELFG